MYYQLRSIIDECVPEDVTHIGFVATNIAGHYLLAEPEGHSDGITATFKQVQLLPRETPVDALIRCIKTQINAQIVSAYPIGVERETNSGTSFYFAGLLDDVGRLSSADGERSAWYSPEETEERIARSENLSCRQRDLELLTEARALCLSPGRRILLMIQELHRQGFERLRAMAFQKNNGYSSIWLCDVAPSSSVQRDHTGFVDSDQDNKLREIMGWGCAPYNLTTATDRQVPFYWDDAGFDSPEELASKFLKRFRECAFMGWGPDPAYVAWFEDMLRRTAPNGVFFPIFSSKKYALSAYTVEELRIPLPPRP